MNYDNISGGTADLSRRLHPYLAQNELRDYCTRKGIALMAYTPSGNINSYLRLPRNKVLNPLNLGYDVVRNDPLIVSLAEKYKVTPTQIILAWHVSRNIILVPTSKKSDRQKENLTVSPLLLHVLIVMGFLIHLLICVFRFPIFLR